MSLKKKAVSGVLWRGSSQISTQIIQFIVIVILAHLLSAKDFGMVQMVVVFTGFLAIFNSLGFDAALIQKDDLSEGHLSSAFWINVFMGFALGGLTVLAAPLIAWFYGEPRVIPIARVMAVGFPLASLRLVQQSLLRKQMAFRTLTLIEVPAMIISGIAGISAAVMGWGVWALVIRELTADFFTTLFLWIRSKWVPRFVFDMAKFREIWGFSWRIPCFGVVNYLRHNVDKILIGRMLGTSALGYYALAYRLMLYPLRYVSHTIVGVAFPTFSQIKNDIVRLRGAYIKMVQYIAIITFPLMSGLLALAPEFVISVFGAKWIPAIFLIQMFCFVGMLQSTITTTGSIFLAVGRTDLMLNVELIVLLVVSGAVYIGVGWGIGGVAVAYAAISLPLWFLYHSVANRQLSLNLTEYIKALAPTFGLAALMSSSIFGIKSLMLAMGLPDLPVLVVSVIAGTAGYLWACAFFRLSSFYELKDIVYDLVNRKILGKNQDEQVPLEE